MLARSLTSTVRRVSAQFPVLLLTGPRQVGKTTLLEACAEPNRSRLSLDDLEQRELARSDPMLFLAKHPPPLLIDEVQYAPQLFPAIKQIVDRERRAGAFWLTGSQKFHLMQGVSESLAGRVAVLDLLGLSRDELRGQADAGAPFLPSREWIEQAVGRAQPMSLHELYRAIWLGSFPALTLSDGATRDVFFRSYVQTYVERDVRALARVGDEVRFSRALRAAAARTGQLVNFAELARDADVDQKTVKSWLSILEASGLIYLLMPYHTNVSKRLIKTPKLYFLDTGLCAYLTQWSSPETLEAGAMSGQILETYAFTEILKTYWHRGLLPSLYFYRDRDQREIDLLIERDGLLYPVEIKKSANPSTFSASVFRTLERLDRPQGEGAVLCLRASAAPLADRVTAVPLTYL